MQVYISTQSIKKNVGSDAMSKALQLSSFHCLSCRLLTSPWHFDSAPPSQRFNGHLHIAAICVKASVTLALQQCQG